MRPLLLNEGKHRDGCSCGFCRNRGSFGKKNKGVDDQHDESSGTEQETEESLAQDVVNAMLEWNPKNPGTQPGIMGTKSFSSTKVPSGHTDRPFSPAPGMVQPDNEIVNKQVKRKVNDGK
jgi:hypothetical protein